MSYYRMHKRKRIGDTVLLSLFTYSDICNVLYVLYTRPSTDAAVPDFEGNQKGLSVRLVHILSFNVSKYIAGWVANSVDPYQTPLSAVSDLGYTACPDLSVPMTRLYKVTCAFTLKTVSDFIPFEIRCSFSLTFSFSY